MIVAAAAAGCRIRMVWIHWPTRKTTHCCPSTRTRSTGRSRRHVELKISAIGSQWRSFVGTSEEPEAAVEPFCHYGGQGCDILGGQDLLASILVALGLFESLHLPYLAGDPASLLGPSGPPNWDRPPPLDRKSLAPLQR